MLGVVPNFAAGPDRYQADLKRSLLLFDKVVIPSIADSRERALADGHEHIAADLDFLAESGLCASALPADYAAARGDPEARMEDERRFGLLEHPVGRHAMTLSRLARGNPDFEIDAWNAQWAVYNKLAPAHRLRAEHHVARALSLLMRNKGEDSHVGFDSMARLGDGQETRREVVLTVVLQDLELLAADAALEDVLAFREETGNRRLLRMLRRWTRGLARSDAPEAEMLEELADLKEAHRRALKVHRLRGRATVLEFGIVSSFELIESLLKLRLAKLAEMGIGLFRSSDYLLEAESDLRGGEVAYLVRAEERLLRSR